MPSITATEFIQGFGKKVFFIEEAKGQEDLFRGVFSIEMEDIEEEDDDDILIDRAPIDSDVTIVDGPTSFPMIVPSDNRAARIQSDGRRSNETRKSFRDSDVHVVADGQARNSLSARRKANVGKTLKCPRCEEKDMTIGSFVNHLRKKHDSTPGNEKIAFQCVCGFVGTNFKAVNNHTNECHLADLKVINKAY